MSMWHATSTTRAIRPASIVVLSSVELGSHHADQNRGRNPVRWRR